MLGLHGLENKTQGHAKWQNSKIWITSSNRRTEIFDIKLSSKWAAQKIKPVPIIL